ncbi:Uncharacterised protein [Escherichia coli]|uniref:Uncharacterized protein n=1 Tax=Escherichia coli TaxID=562 RepID=A0A376TX59_ECOLX|nr:Uncharacterised protein [Escherichia coli]
MATFTSPAVSPLSAEKTLQSAAQAFIITFFRMILVDVRESTMKIVIAVTQHFSKQRRLRPVRLTKYLVSEAVQRIQDLLKKR